MSGMRLPHADQRLKTLTNAAIAAALACGGSRALMPRENEVIDYVALGKSNKVIAMELGLSIRTVETHRARIFRKMGVRNATELARRVYAPHLWE